MDQNKNTQGQQSQNRGQDQSQSKRGSQGDMNRDQAEGSREQRILWTLDTTLMLNRFLAC